MKTVKVGNWTLLEIILLASILLFIVLHGIIRDDSIIAIISATCGILYTFIAGKGNPICYIFGLTGSGFYCYLAQQNALWGNLVLYSCYYIPMQILGYINWNKNLQTNKNEIVKIRLPKKDCLEVILFSILGVIALSIFLYNLKDSHPLLDSITAIFSIAGLYLTVKRAIEQWLFWMIVNGLSLWMWLQVALSGARVYSTVAMWAVYLFLAFYFYFNWKKEISITQNQN